MCPTVYDFWILLCRDQCEQWHLVQTLWYCVGLHEQLSAPFSAVC